MSFNGWIWIAIFAVSNMLLRCSGTWTSGCPSWSRCCSPCSSKLTASATTRPILLLSLIESWARSRYYSKVHWVYCAGKHPLACFSDGSPSLWWGFGPGRCPTSRRKRWRGAIWENQRRSAYSTCRTAKLVHEDEFSLSYLFHSRRTSLSCAHCNTGVSLCVQFCLCILTMHKVHS